MGPLDLLIIFFAVVIVAFLTYQRMARALFSLGVLWMATLVSALLYKEAAYRVKALTGPNRSLAEGLMFMGLLLLFTIIGYGVFRVSFPVTKLPKLGILDYVMAFLLSLIFAAILVALLYNATGMMVSEQWTNYNAWVRMRNNFYTSPLRPFSQTVMNVYGALFSPFLRPLPPPLTLL